MRRITGLSKKNNFVLAIRDADVVAATLRRALAEASPEERLGLERAAALVELTATATETQLRARWAPRSRLADVGFTGDITSVAAVRALRQAEPKLSLLAAVQLQKEAVAHPEVIPSPLTRGERRLPEMLRCSGGEEQVLLTPGSGSVPNAAVVQPVPPVNAL